MRLSIVLAAFAALIAVVYLVDRPSDLGIDLVALQNRTIYDISDMKAPAMNEGFYKLFVRLLDTWPISKLLLWKMKGDSEFQVVAHFAAHNVRVPLFVPSSPPHAWVKDRAEEESKKWNLQEFVAKFPGDRAKGFHWNSVDDYIALYKSGKKTPVDVVKSIVKFVHASDEAKLPIRAFIFTNETELIAQAEASALRWKEGKTLGPLDGVPVAVKDEFKVQGYKWTMGSNGHIIGFEPEPADSAVIDRLRKSGAIIVPKANQHEFGVLPIGYNQHYGDARNPYNPEHITGGSSSGPAVAVAAGFAPISLGADGGGSIRIPAGLCGLSGLKPTHGRVPHPLILTVGVAGPIAATIKDLAIGYSVLAGPHEEDIYSQVQPPLHLADIEKTADLRPIRIGIYEDYFNDADPEIVKACRAAVDDLQARGARVKNITIPYLQILDRAHKITIMSEFALNLIPLWESAYYHIGEDARIPFILGRSFSSREYLAAQQIRAYFAEMYDFIYRDIDVMIVPTTAVPAPKNEGRVPDAAIVSKLMRFITTANFIGLPALSTPVGYTSSGLPISVQLIGRHWEEELLLRMGAAIEEGLNRRKPQVYYDIINN